LMYYTVTGFNAEKRESKPVLDVAYYFPNSKY